MHAGIKAWYHRITAKNGVAGPVLMISDQVCTFQQNIRNPVQPCKRAAEKNHQPDLSFLVENEIKNLQ